MDITGTIDRKRINTLIWVCLNILEGGICFIITLLIPADPQNALFLGYSPFRLATLSVILFLLGVNVFIWVKLSSVMASLEKFAERAQPSIWKLLAGVFLAVCVWIILWMPATRFGDYEAVFVRLQPLLLWVSLLGLQFVVLLTFFAEGIDLNKFWKAIKENRKALIINAGVWLTLVVVFFILRSTSLNGLLEETDFPPGAPLAPLQLVTACCLGFVIYLLEGKVHKNRSTIWVTVILFFILWGTAILVWSGTPFTCTDDRIGPYAPNFICYPDSHDAVYSIGSHYTALGEGINNHWMTDKPLYMIILAIGQWITSPMIDDYLFFQLVIIALIPGLLFILGKKLIGLSGGVFLSLLSIFLGRNALLLYQFTGSVNVRTENPELLTGLFLVLLSLSVFQWFRKPAQAIWSVLSAGILGLSVLVRFNPLLIAPLLLCIYIPSDWRQRKRVFLNTTLFIVTFCLVVGPWFIGSRDVNGRSFYLLKIEDVIRTRFSLPAEETMVDQQAVDTAVTPLVVLQTIPTAGETAQSTGSYTSAFGLRFLNNIYLSILILPDTFTVNQLEVQVTQSIWDWDALLLAWEYDLTVENLVVLFLNTLIVLAGITWAARKFGSAGLVPLIIYTGYHAANSLAGTSGGRYLEPVTWVILFYFCTGIIMVMAALRNQFSIGREPEPVLPEGLSPARQADLRPRKQIVSVILIMLVFFTVGMGLLVVNNWQGAFPAESGQAADDQAYDALHDAAGITAQDWQAFLADPQSMVVEGYAFHPQVFLNPYYSETQESFELLVLGRDHLLTSYLFNGEISGPFQDGSRVILVGCRQTEDVLWYASRIVMRSYAVIQLDNEGNTIVDMQTDWTCQ